MPHYIIDGYNVVKQIPEYMDIKLKDGREGLINILKYQRPQGNTRNKATIVFDGKGDDFLFSITKITGDNIDVMFSQNESADDHIQRMVKRSSKPGDIVVVTDDRDLRSSCKIHGAQLLYVKEFIKPKQKYSVPAKNQPKQQISQKDELALDRELRKLWKI
ncbi:MAG: hypothetical protein A2252_06595 [Elusimicrobia bacterium RIFOXYA2_FULL_39_19]|nr:MAG: hypothetical protein A2252_06595 [Elusimicrobia bacterium RIFOXYA2_FULL_39_19]